MTLSLLTPGEMGGPEFMFEPGGGLRTRRFSVAVAVLRGDDGKVTLIDCGFSRAEMADPIKEMGVAHGLLMSPRGGAEASVAAQLQAADIDPRDVTAIVATHLHIDHIGAFCDFPNARVFASEAEFTSGRARGPLGGYIHIEAIDRQDRAELVHLDGQGRHGFPAHRDLFGDGRVLMLDARGHSAGSVAVLLTDPGSGRQALMAGDAAFSTAEYRLGKMMPFQRMVAFSADWTRATWGRLRDFETDHPDIPVILSHDPDNARRAAEWSLPGA